MKSPVTLVIYISCPIRWDVVYLFQLELTLEYPEHPGCSGYSNGNLSSLETRQIHIELLTRLLNHDDYITWRGK